MSDFCTHSGSIPQNFCHCLSLHISLDIQPSSSNPCVLVDKDPVALRSDYLFLSEALEQIIKVGIWAIHVIVFESCRVRNRSIQKF